MKYSKYSTFVKIYEAGSFSRAAEEMNFTQSAISQFIQKFEHDLGVSLLHRGKKGITLTSSGERLLPYFYEMMGAETRLEAALSITNRSLNQTIRIGAIPSVACYLLPEVIRSFRNKYPLVKYQISDGNYLEVEQKLVEGKVDLGFVRMPCDYKFDLFRFQPEKHVVIMHRSHPLASRTILSIKDIHNQDFILLDNGYTEIMMDYFKKNKASPRIRERIKNNLAVFSFVANGLGISIIPEPLTRMAPVSVCYKYLDPPLYRSIAIACKDKKKLTVAEKLFLNEVVEVGKQMVGSDLFMLPVPNAAEDEA